MIDMDPIPDSMIVEVVVVAVADTVEALLSTMAKIPTEVEAEPENVEVVVVAAADEKAPIGVVDAVTVVDSQD